MKKIEIKQALLYVVIMLLFQAVIPVSISKLIIINPEYIELYLNAFVLSGAVIIGILFAKKHGTLQLRKSSANLILFIQYLIILSITMLLTNWVLLYVGGQAEIFESIFAAANEKPLAFLLTLFIGLIKYFAKVGVFFIVGSWLGNISNKSLNQIGAKDAPPG